jgi:hypothetical protein
MYKEKQHLFRETNGICCKNRKFTHIAMTTISQQVPERETLAADGPSFAANSKPRHAGILRVLVPHCFR